MTTKPEVKEIIVEPIEDILKLTDPFEMDARIAKNSTNILSIFQKFQNKLYENTEILKDEIDLLIHCLKFVDTLNLFMPNQTISILLRYMNEIYDVVCMLNNFDSKDQIIKQIKYTEMTVIYLKKKTFKNLFFTDGKALAKEIEYNLEQVNKTGKFDQRLFKQMQNLFYVVQGKIEEKKRSELQQKLNEMKVLSIKIKKMRFGNIIIIFNNFLLIL